jgi:CDP-diacylglycerol--inositol 3-phosphatidyltransferase
MQEVIVKRDQELAAAYSRGYPSRILCYIPNLIDYTRFVLLVIAFNNYAFTSYKLFIVIYLLAYLLDELDGRAARRYKQCKG